MVPACRVQGTVGRDKIESWPQPQPCTIKPGDTGRVGWGCQLRKCSPTEEPQAALPQSIQSSGKDSFSWLCPNFWSTVCPRDLSYVYIHTYSLNNHRHSLHVRPWAHAGQAVCTLVLGGTHTNHSVGTPQLSSALHSLPRTRGRTHSCVCPAWVTLAFTYSPGLATSTLKGSLFSCLCPVEYTCPK